MCPECEKWKKLYIDSLIERLEEAIDYYEYLVREYGRDCVEAKEIGRLLAKVALALEQKANVKQNSQTDPAPG